MRVRPSHRRLQHQMQIVQANVGRNLYPTPDLWADILEVNLELVHSRYGSSHAFSSPFSRNRRRTEVRPLPRSRDLRLAHPLSVQLGALPDSMLSSLRFG